MTPALAAVTQTAATFPVSVWVAGIPVRLAIAPDSISVEEAGNQEPATCRFIVEDPRMQYGAIQEESFVHIRDHDNGNKELFQGYVRSLKIESVAIGRRIHVSAADVGSMLDRILVPFANRAAESDRARLSWLMSEFGAKVPAGYPPSGLNASPAMIETIEASLPAAKLRNVTLRQAIEMTAAAASPSARYYIDNVGRLVYYSLATVAAPYTVAVTTSPSSTQVAPEALEIDWDSANLCNRVFVRAADSRASGWFADLASMAKYGIRSDYIDGPDVRGGTLTENQAKARKLGRAVLTDRSEPIVRGSFEVSNQDKVYRVISGSRRYWEPGQSISVISDAHGMPSASPGSSRIARVTTRFLSGNADRKVSVEFGGTRMRHSVVNRRSSSNGQLVGQRLAGTVGGTYRG